MCSTEDRCSECSHLSLLQFQAYVKDAEMHSAKEKMQAKLSGGSSEKRSCWSEPASEAPWGRRFVAVESDLAAMKASIGQLSAVLLPLASDPAGSQWRAFSRCSWPFHGVFGAQWSDGNFAGLAGMSSMGMPHVDWLHGSMPLQALSWPVDASVDPSGTVVSQAAAMGWPSFSEEVDQVFDDIPCGEAGTPDEEGAASFRELITSVRESLDLPMPSSLTSTLQTGVERTSGTSGPGPTPLVLPHSPLALEVCREQLGCSLGISNPASAKFTLPRRSGSGPLAGLSSAGPQEGLDCLGALARANLDIMQPCEMLRLRMMMLCRQAVIACGLASTAWGVRAKASHAVGSRHLHRLRLLWFRPLLLLRSGQPISGNGSTVSASQGSTRVPLEVFAGTSCIPSTVSARWAPADVGSAVVPKEGLAGCFRPRLVAGGSKSSVIARPHLVVGSGSTSEMRPVCGAAPGTNPVLRCFPAQVGSSLGRFSGFRSLDYEGAGAPHKSSGAFGSLSGSPAFSAGLVGIGSVCDV
ncbi:hypothetical protein E2C01_049780 [Portunus trituberculatus]|uniref:Uncharacterized protein n=1 Tax=Portunus trituberculatus TaxID=210409 RepID=A0A5B7GEQ3_PORTR|nr:hypothetical protein [Portunus trituberculatus]